MSAVFLTQPDAWGSRFSFIYPWTSEKLLHEQGSCFTICQNMHPGTFFSSLHKLLQLKAGQQTRVLCFMGYPAGGPENNLHPPTKRKEGADSFTPGARHSAQALPRGHHDYARCLYLGGERQKQVEIGRTPMSKLCWSFLDGNKQST